MVAGNAAQQAAAKAAAEKDSRLEQMHKKAALRLGNQGLLRGWTMWQDQHTQAMRQKRMLAAAGARLARPALMAAMSKWRADWQQEAAAEAAEAAKSTEQRLEESHAARQVLQELVQQLREEHQQQMLQAREKQKAALERLKLELTGSAEQQAAAREAAEKERRIEVLHKKAAARIGNQGLMRGWTCWHEIWAEATRQKRMLAAAGARLAKPGLTSSFTHWRNDWQGEAVLGIAQKLQRKDERIAALEQRVMHERSAGEKKLQVLTAPNSPLRPPQNTSPRPSPRPATPAPHHRFRSWTRSASRSRRGWRSCSRAR